MLDCLDLNLLFQICSKRFIFSEFIFFIAIDERWKEFEVVTLNRHFDQNTCDNYHKYYQPETDIHILFVTLVVIHK